MEMKKILAIGNSFSQDAVRYLYDIAAAEGKKLRVVNLYIGGCSLERHAENIRGDISDYDYELNGGEASGKISVKSALGEADWDAVTIQQVSGKSGLPESYEPFGDEVLSCIKECKPRAKVYFHQTWAYEIGSGHGDFPAYGCSQERMFESIVSASESFARMRGLEIIPCGRLIQRLRSFPEFDVRSGGMSLCRDGFHLSADYGRYAAGAMWYSVLFRAGLGSGGFIPGGTDEDLIRKIRNAVNELWKGRKDV